MRRFVLAALFCLLAPATLAGAATANFQGNCTSSGSTVSCTFDGLRPTSAPSSCPGSFIYKYFWQFGDGGTAYTGNNQVSHNFDASSDYVVQLRVICFDGTYADKTRALCIHVGVPGCVQVGMGWN